MTKIVEVVWGDAHVSTSEISVKKAKTVKPIITVTVGFLVEENDEGVIISMDRWPKHPKQFKVHTFVPWGMILEYYEYYEDKG